MSFFKKNKPVHPLHRKWTWRDQLKDFWLCNKTMIGIIIVLTCICILVYMIGFASGHHVFSTEANRYEHLSQII